jgi:conjugal transfer pilus assembly protein TraW
MPHRFGNLCFFIMMILGLSSVSFGKNIGTIGQVYPIAEPDFLEFIQSRAASMQQNGLLTRLQQDMQKSAVLYRDRPTPVSGMDVTRKEKSWLIDPSIVLDHDITTPDGRLIATSGTRVNPLDYISLSKTLLFYDADDEEQQKWAMRMDKNLNGNDKIILIKGSVLTEENRLQKAIYFDQAGKLTTRFHIQHVPATVSEENHSLRINEVLP